MASTDMLKTVLNGIKSRLDRLNCRINYLIETKVDKASVMQSDWSQNDSSKPDYIKNRICYYDENGATIKLQSKYIPTATSENVGGIKASTSLDENGLYEDLKINSDGTGKFDVWYTETYEGDIAPGIHSKAEWNRIYNLVTKYHATDVRIYIKKVPSKYSSGGHYEIRVRSMLLETVKFSDGNLHKVYYGIGDNALDIYRFIVDLNSKDQTKLTVNFSKFGLNYGGLTTLLEGNDKNRYYLMVDNDNIKATDEILIHSSTIDSTKKFKITVDDTGEPTFIDTSDSSNSWSPSNYNERMEAVENALPGKLSEPAEGLAVGKYFRVAAIDESGHAVLEAVDAPKEGLAITPTGWPDWTADEQAAARERMGIPGDYELIADVTTEEDVDQFYIDKDNGGTDFKLVKAIIFSEVPKYVGSLSSLHMRTYVYAVNDLGQNESLSAANIFLSKSYNTYARTEIDLTGGIPSVNQYVLRASKIGSTNASDNFGYDYDQAGTLLYVYKIGHERYNSNTPIIPAGTRIKLYGVRA